MDTLRLLSKVVPEYVHPVDEEGVCAGAFELIFAFDEVISMGYRESITVAQVDQASACSWVPACSDSKHISQACALVGHLRFAKITVLL